MKDEGEGDLNFPPKKNLARQLDFNNVGGSLSAPAQATVMLPENPHRPVVVQMHLPKQFLVQQQSLRPMVPESPKARPRQNGEGKDGTPKKQKHCNCKHSKCLKLYCECFSSGVYCDGCNCVNCHNNIENEVARLDAVGITLDRNPHAFRPKIASSPHKNRDNREEAGEVVVIPKHNKGCHCKKSGCLKKYCECFQANILCSENCKCMDCKNFEGNEERQALSHVDSINNIVYLQQAANAAITGAIGTSGYGSGYGSPPVSRKRRAQELYFGGGPAIKDPSFYSGVRFPEFVNQMNHLKASTSWPSVPVPLVANNAPVAPSKFAYRSLLADMIGSNDMKELCAVLVVCASRLLISDERNEKEKMTTGESSLASSLTNGPQSPKTDDSLSGPHTNKACPDESGSDGPTDASGTRPMSPGTLALMCDEQDTVFINSNLNGLGSEGVFGNLQTGQVVTESYAEQEKTVLTMFRDCLNKLITLGEIKEKQCYSLARSDSGGQSQTQAYKSSTTNIHWDPFINSLTKSTTTQSSQNNDNHTHSIIHFHAENRDLKLNPEKDA